MGVELPRGILHRTYFISRFLAVLALILVISSLQPGTAAAQDWSAPRTVFVPTTGHTTDGLFLNVWRTDRDLVGDPITEEFQPRTGYTGAGHPDVVQYYEHLALMYLPDEEPDQQVQALDLGRQALDEALAGGGTQALKRALERAVCSPAAGPCANVVSTGHTLHEPFLSYWQAGETATWLGPPLTEALTAPDGTRVQYFSNGILRVTAADSVSPLPLGTIAAGRAKIATKPIAQPSDVPEYDEALFIPPEAPAPSDATSDWTFGPGPQQGAYKEVVVSISAERMWAYEGGELVMSSLVSTGVADSPETVTPVGYHSILSKYDVQTMEGVIDGQHYRVEDVPYVMYFDDLGNALHGTYWHNNFGNPMSHGCVNLPMDVAAWMYDWAPVGTAVTVVG